MDELLYALYWWTLTALLGGIVAFVLPVRRRWLVLPMVLLALAFIVPAALARNGGVHTAVWISAAFAPYILFWTAGVYAGSGLRARLWPRARRRRASPEPPVASS